MRLIAFVTAHGSLRRWRPSTPAMAAGITDHLWTVREQMPVLFSRLRSAIDEQRQRNGRFLLLGSVAPALMGQVGESLAGRLALCELAPLIAAELPANIRKRLVKSPKFYWRDSGLLHALLDLPAAEDLLARPWVGASWEGWVIEQILAHPAAHGRSAQAFYLRTSDRYEIDLLLECNHRRWAFDIKLTSSPAPADLEDLGKKADLVGADGYFLLSRTPGPIMSERHGSLDLQTCLDFLLSGNQTTRA